MRPFRRKRERPAPECRHLCAVPVVAHPDDVTVLAMLCPDCDAELPADFDPHAFPPIHAVTVLG